MDRMDAPKGLAGYLLASHKRRAPQAMLIQILTSNRQIKMTVSIQVILGLIIGWTGLLWIADSPGPAASTLLLAGVLILRGIDRLGRSDEQSMDE